MALLAVVAAALVPATAHAAVTATVTGDDGNPIPVAGTLNIRNMSPTVALTSTAERYNASIAGPNGARVSAGASCATGSSTQPVDYVGNGTYTITISTFAAGNSSCTGTPTATQALPFAITASTAFGPPPVAALTRPPGQTAPNTVTLALDLNPGASSTDVFYERGAPPNADGSLPGAVTQAFPDTNARTVGIRLDKGPGLYYVAGHAAGLTGQFNGQAFGPWATPAVIRTYAPFDLQKFTWTDSRGPSYRLSAVVRATGANGRVNIAIGRGTKGRYRSYGTVKIRKHRFSKRFRLTRVGKYRIRFKYKGNATVAGGFEVHKFQITRRVVFRGAVARGATLRR